jgi:hypothetical protein
VTSCQTQLLFHQQVAASRATFLPFCLLMLLSKILADTCQVTPCRSPYGPAAAAASRRHTRRCPAQSCWAQAALQ